MLDKRPIRGFETYLIDTNGIVYSPKGTLICGHVSSHGYVHMSLFYKGKKYVKLAHRLVAQTFLANPKKKPLVNHKNGIKTDNRLENLEWSTSSENVKHSYASGLQKRLRGQKSPQSIWLTEDVVLMRQMQRRGHTATDIATYFGAKSVDAIRRILRGERYGSNWN